jgi:hypothetical protein
MFLLLAVLVLAASLVPFDLALRYATGVFGGSATSRHLNPAIYSVLALRLRLLSSVLLLAGIVVFRLRSSASRRLGGAATALYRSVCKEWRRLFLARPSLIHVVAAIAVCLIALGQRIAFLGVPMRHDEAATFMYYARRPLWAGLSLYTLPNNHLFHTALVYASTRVFGPDVWAIRLPALVAGVSLIPLVGYLARRMWGAPEALLAMALAASSSVWIEYSVNARGYSLLACFFLVLVIAGEHLVTAAAPAWFLVWSAAAVLGLYTMPSFLMSVAASVLWMGWRTWKARRRLRRLILQRGALALGAVASATALLYLPPALATGIGSLTSNEYVRSEGARFWTMNWTEVLRLAALVHRDLPVFAPVLGGALAALGVAFCPRIRSFLSLLACVLLSSVAFLAVFRFAPPWRAWLVYTPCYLLCVAAGMVALLRRVAAVRIRVGAYAAFLSVALALLLGSAVSVNRGIVHSPGDSGLLDGGPEIVDFLLSRNAQAANLAIGPASMPSLRYYWWRRTAFDSEFTDLRTIQTHLPAEEIWCVVNSRRNESLAGVLGTFGFEPRRVLESRIYGRAVLYRVEIAGKTEPHPTMGLLTKPHIMDERGAFDRRITRDRNSFDAEMGLEDGIEIFGGDALPGSRGPGEPRGLPRESLLDTQLAGQDLALESNAIGVGSARIDAWHVQFLAVSSREMTMNGHCVHLGFRLIAPNPGNISRQSYPSCC